MGDSLAIVGGDPLYRVHIHTARPEAVLATAGRAGAVREAATTSLGEQVADCLGRAARGVQAGGGAITTAECVLIAVLEPSEVADAIRSLGAIIVEPAGESGRTVKRIGEALGSTPARSAVVLVEAARASLLAAGPTLVEAAFVAVPQPAGGHLGRGRVPPGRRGGCQRRRHGGRRRALPHGRALGAGAFR